ncbi:MAG: hypothetical protein MUC28_00660 [Planctomycetes bacterium]|jgi:hypothetical protein|nr:hypothetical protein [Planctomycetota bacterium]
MKRIRIINVWHQAEWLLIFRKLAADIPYIGFSGSLIKHFFLFLAARRAGK